MSGQRTSEVRSHEERWDQAERDAEQAMKDLGIEETPQVRPHIQVDLDVVNHHLAVQGKITRKGDQVKIWIPGDDGNGVDKSYLHAGECAELSRAFASMAHALGGGEPVRPTATADEGTFQWVALSDARIGVLRSRAGGHYVGAPATREEERAMAIEIWQARGRRRESAPATSRVCVLCSQSDPLPGRVHLRFGDDISRYTCWPKWRVEEPDHDPVPGGRPLEPEGGASPPTDRANRGFDSPDGGPADSSGPGIVSEPYDCTGTPGRACAGCNSAWPATEPDDAPWHHEEGCPVMANPKVKP